MIIDTAYVRHLEKEECIYLYIIDANKVNLAMWRAHSKSSLKVRQLKENRIQ